MLPTVTGADVPRSIAATFDSSLRGSPTPPKLTWVFWRNTLPAELTLRDTSTAAALRFGLLPELLRLLVTSLLFAHIGQPFEQVGAIPDFIDGKPFPQYLFDRSSPGTWCA